MVCVKGVLVAPCLLLSLNATFRSRDTTEEKASVQVAENDENVMAVDPSHTMSSEKGGMPAVTIAQEAV